MGLNIAYKIVINGRDLTPLWVAEKRLLGIEVEDREGEASDAATLTLDDRAPHIAWPPEGAQLRLWLGNSTTDMVDMGSYTLDAPEASSPPDLLIVKGHAANYITAGQGMPMQSHRSRAWSIVSLSDMANTIALEHGLIARVQATLAGELVDAVEQVDESNLAFLSRIAKRFDGRVRIKGASAAGGVLEVVGAGAQLPQVVLTRADVADWSAPLGTRIKPGTVVASWHNPKSGASGVKHAGDKDPRLVLAEVFDSASAAASACKSRMKDKTRHAAQLNLTLVRLDTTIASGTAIALSGFRSEIDSVWNVVQVTHRATARSARTSITAERAT